MIINWRSSPGGRELGDREGRPYISPTPGSYMKCRGTPGECPLAYLLVLFKRRKVEGQEGEKYLQMEENLGRMRAIVS